MLHSMSKMTNIRAFLQPPNSSLYERADEKTTCVPATLEKMQMFEYFERLYIGYFIAKTFHIVFLSSFYESDLKDKRNLNDISYVSPVFFKSPHHLQKFH